MTSSVNELPVPETFNSILLLWQQIENRSNNIGENLSELTEFVKDLDAENQQKLEDLSSLMAYTSNLTRQQLMDVTSQGFYSLKTSLRRKISELEASNVHLRLDSKVEFSRVFY